MFNNVQKLYDKYQNDQVTFNSEVVKITGLRRGLTNLKCGTERLVSILYSLSMKQARLICQLDKNWFDLLKAANNFAKISLTFYSREMKQDVFILISGKIIDFSAYQGSADNVYFVSIEFRKKAPDLLIEILGELLEERTEQEKRIFERITLDPQRNAQMGIHPAETYLFKEGKAKRCILNELSLFSAQCVVQGNPGDYLGARIMLLLKIDALKELGELVGNVISEDIIKDSPTILSVVVEFDHEVIPPSYKMFIGRYIDVMFQNKR
jgi:hypothetical protein